jgi:hypothetical protein
VGQVDLVEGLVKVLLDLLVAGLQLNLLNQEIQVLMDLEIRVVILYLEDILLVEVVALAVLVQMVVEDLVVVQI